MLNPHRNASSSKRKFEVGINTLALLLCVVGLTGMSLMSFFQTQSAFLPLNDPTMVFQGIQFGSGIAFLSALIFQYGQNAALYVKSHYATGKVVINLFGMFDIKDTTICWLVFWICAGIDAGTNCLWLYNQPDIRKQHIVFQTIEYSAMIFVVFVEEVLGIVLQALFHSFTTWKQISVSNRGETERKNNNSDGSNRYREQELPIRTSPKSNYQPKNKPGKNNNQSRNEPTYHSIQKSNENKSKLGSLLSPKPKTWMDDEKEIQRRMTNPELYKHGLDELGMEHPNWDENSDSIN